MNKDQFKLYKITQATKLHQEAMPLIKEFLFETNVAKKFKLAIKIKAIQAQINIVLSMALPQYPKGSAIKECGPELIIK